MHGNSKRAKITGQVHGLTVCPCQVCLRWNIDRGVGVIPESGSAEHIKENIDGIYDWKLAADLKVNATCQSERFIL